jgi:cytochrome d ubiquinol oxidase subunit II
MVEWLPNVWLLIIGLLLLYYAITDGFDLGVGIISFWPGQTENRGLMMDSLGPIWHINQTWLVVLGGMLFGSFPLFYSLLFSALYLPSMVMLFGFVFRGIAFDFREHSQRPGSWEMIFSLGSLIITLSQGFALGGLLSGLEIKNGAFMGTPWDWLNPFSALVALGVLSGYVMLGANYLIFKTEGALRERSFRLSWISSVFTLIISVLVYLALIWKYPQTARKWSTFPDLYFMSIFPLLAALAGVLFFRSLWKRYDRAPLFWNSVLIFCSFIGVSISLYPHMIPNVVSPVTVAEAAASSKTLIFMLVVTAILTPLIVFYTSYTYKVFSGKIKSPGDYGG